MVLQQNRNFSSEGVNWWFVFKDVDNRWWGRFLKPGYQHVFAVTWMNDLSMVVEPLMGACNIMLTDVRVADMLATYIDLGYRVVYIRHDPQPEKFKMRGPLLTCASYLAYTIGIKFYGVTAYQLYKKLIRMGGEEYADEI